MAVFVALILGSLAARLVGWLGVDYIDGGRRRSPWAWR